MFIQGWSILVDGIHCTFAKKLQNKNTLAVLAILSHGEFPRLLGRPSRGACVCVHMATCTHKAYLGAQEAGMKGQGDTLPKETWPSLGFSFLSRKTQRMAKC